MRTTVTFGAGDVRIENVTDARLIEPTDADVTITRACIYGSHTGFRSYLPLSQATPHTY